MSGNAGLRVLVIDDDAVLRALLEAVLPIEGHSAVMAETGAEGVGALHGSAAFDAVLCDLHLPDVTSEELWPQLRDACSANAVLLAMSATRPADAAIEGFDGFLQKPFQVEEIVGAVGRARRVVEARGAKVMAEPAFASEAMPPLDEGIFSRLAGSLPAQQLLELYMMTLDDVGQRVERMRGALSVRDGELLRREAHAIKGGCGMVGALELRELAAAAEGGSPECTPPLADFSRACLRLERMLNARLA